ncbi:Putative complex 1 LYR protein [Septoria linicola]|uniref:Mitochondrial zinc maintenance protein 1, mitochondrial n=1 Tax=Septoria linicola TaxID=215465 RepID=A0A9Q9ASX5_9PEZI|nr:putative complex 1 LYR protein [Septoria linicola]USW55222.1 Putative complex 1 LYR protein [Septoria linicola]
MASKVLTNLEVATNRFAVLATYRHLLRATRIAFQGDNAMLRSSRAFARTEFRTGAKLTPDSLEAAQGVEHAQGVTQILRENVVQGKKVGDVGEKYKLNIHEHTQRLDNDTAGKLKGTTKSFKEVKANSLL